MIKRLVEGVEIKNKKAYFDFFIIEEVEVGIELKGKEVKSIKAGKCNLKGSWCDIKNGEMYTYGIHISNFQDSAKENLLTRLDPYRVRKLLLHKKELLKFEYRKKTEGITFVPLKLYESHGKIKMKLGVCKGKKKVDKRETIKERDLKRELERS